MKSLGRGNFAPEYSVDPGNAGDRWAAASALFRLTGSGAQADAPPPSTDYKAKIDAVEAGVNQSLARVEALLATEAFAENLPFIGAQLKTAYDAGNGAVQTITGLKNAIVGALDAVSNLGDLSTKTAGEVQNLIQTTLTNQLNALGAGYVGLVTTSTVGSDGSFSLTFDTGRSIALGISPGSLGMDGLNLAIDGEAQAQLAWNFDFKVGIDTGGFYLDTSASNLSLGATVDLGTFSADANLGFLHFSATNIDDAASGADTLNLTLGTSWNTVGKIYSAGLSNDLLNVSASGNLDLDLHLAGDMGAAVLPSIGADLHVNWRFNQNILNGAGANGFGQATIVFDHVQYDLGSFVQDFVTPILEKLDPILAPINEALSVLRTELDFLPQDWQNLIDVTGNLDGSPDGKATVLDLIKLARPDIDMGPIASLIDTVDKIVDFVEFFRGRDFSDAGYDLGSYSTVISDIQDAANSLSSITVNAADFIGSGVGLTSFLAGLTGAGFGDDYTGTENDFDGKNGADLFGDLIGNDILQFPILENPINVIKLLFGQNVDLFRLDLPAIDLSAGFDADGNVTSPIPILPLPIWPLPLITGQIGVAFQAVIDLAFGYDTTGLIDYRNGGFTDLSKVFNGFYLDDQRSGGIDIPEIILRAAIDIAIDANLGIVSVGGGGNIIGEVALDFADSLFGADGRLYLNELTFNLADNPFGLFDVEGRITAGLRAYVNTPFGTLWRWNSDRLTLADFSFVQGAEPAGPPPGLADQSSGDLILNIGARAVERDIADMIDGYERFEITTQGGHLLVSAFSTGQIFNEDGSVTRIVADGGAYDDEILLDKSVAVAAALTGGLGSDTLGGGIANDTLGGGDDNDWLLGRAGQDTLHGDNGDDYLDGGAGGDALDGGAGFDTATYVSYKPVSGSTGITLNLTNLALNTFDAAGDTFASIEIFEGSKYNDIFTGTVNTDVFSGIEGNDTLNGDGGNDILVGGLGADRLNGGDGYDIVSYYLSAAGVTVTINGTSGSGAGGEAQGDLLTGIEEVDGSNGADHLVGGNGQQIFYGEDGIDTLEGGAGDDLLSGGGGADVLVGGEGYDYATYDTAIAGIAVSLTTGTGTAGEALGETLSGIENAVGSDYADIITGDAGGNILLGGDGDDTLGGAAGMDVLEGGAGGDAMDGGADRDMASYARSGAAITLDFINGTRGGDAIGDTFLNIEIYDGSQYDDFIRGTNAGEEIRGEAGLDSLFGAGGDDTILGGDGNDTLDGEAGSDVLHGGLGNDRFYGGTERDRVTYFDSAAGVRVNLSGANQAFGVTTLAAFSALDGMGGTDTFMATIATSRSSVEDATGSTFADLIVASEDGSMLVGLGGNDQLRGLGGADRLNGGTGDDKLDGGAGSSDVATYIDDAAGVVASLTTKIATQGAGAGTDTLIGLEGLTGSSFADTLTGDGGVNALTGGGGDDVLDGLAGADRMDGGAGNDIFTVDNAGDIVTDTGGDVADMIKASIDYSLAGSPAIEQIQLLGSATTGTGNASSNLLIGNANANALDGGGNGEGDTFWGYAGNDLYVFDSLGDAIGTGAAPRTGITGAGEAANGGTDEIRLKTANIFGGTFETPTVYTYSLDRADLRQVENLTLTDSDRAVNLTGNALGNRLIGNTQWQTLDGAGGNDTLDAGLGRDIVHGGTGTDTLRLSWSSLDYDIVTSFAGSTSGYSGTYYYRNNGDYYIYARNDFDGVERFDLTLGSGSDDLRTGDADDVVAGNAGNDILRTGKGADVVTGGDDADASRGVDTWVGDKSNAAQGMTIDLTVNTASTYTIGAATGSVAGIERLGESVAEKFSSGTGADTIRTMDARYDDYIASNAGADTVSIAGGRDWIDLGAGFDTLAVDWSDLDYDIVTSGAFTGPISDGYDGAYYYRNNGDYFAYDRADFVDAEKFDIKTGSGNDDIATGAADDIVSTGAGDDVIRSLSGKDVVDGGSGNDRWDADQSGAGATQPMILNLRSAGLQATYLGTGTVRGIEMLTLATGAGSDRITTLDARFDDQIRTDLGNDIVTLAGGRDTINLGGGSDKLVVDWSDLDYDIVTNTFVGSLVAGYDSAYYYRNNGDYYVYDRVDYKGVETFDVTTGSGADDIRTGDAADTVRTGAGNDIIRSGFGADIVDGGNDADGSRGADTWVADKSAATVALLFDLTKIGAAYTIAGVQGSIRGIEVLGLDALTEKFSTGSGADGIVTLDSRYNDFIATNGGNDSVTIAGGRDWIDLGTGADTLIVNWSDLDYDIVTTALTANGNGGLDGGYYYRNNGDYYLYDRANFVGVETFDITTGSGGGDIRTGDAADTVSTGAGNDIIRSGLGADVVDGGNDTDGSRGIDTWVTDKSPATLGMTIDLTKAGATYKIAAATGSVRGIEALGIDPGSEKFSTGSGADTIVTMNARYNDFIATNGGNDSVAIAGGRDWIDFGLGADTLKVDWSDLDYDIVTTLGVGIDGGYDGAFYYRNNGDYYLYDRADFKGVETFVVTTGSGNDDIVTGTGADTVAGGAGDDRIASGSGADVVDGGDGNDRWEADQSALTASQPLVIDVSSGGVNALLAGGGSVRNVEMLTLQTGAGNDVVKTRDARFDDVVSTNLGSDFVTVAGGRDMASLGGQASNGADTLIVDWSDLDYDIVTSISGSLAAGYQGAFYYRNNGDYSGYDRVDFTGVERFDIIVGSANDTIVTGAGADRVRGGGGGDYLNGGGGVDTVDYGDKAVGIAVTLKGAVETQVAVGGVVEDTILNFENVVGGSGDDTITGDGGANALSGGAGNDTIIGGLGNDMLDGGDGIDTLSYAGGNKTIRISLAILTAQNTSGAGVDTILGFENLIGSSANDVLTGSDVANRIDGGKGNDTMTGGAGNDTYVVDATADRVIEDAGGGTDLVESSASFTLGDAVENLTLTGTKAIDATGNDLANILIGNSGANVLNGGTGADRMTGGDGNDTYVVDVAGDVVSETSAAGGLDTVVSAITYTLGTNLENLRLIGSAAINGTGNALDNVLTGNDAVNRLSGGAGADTLDGGGGADILTGGTGDDTYIVDTVGEKAVEAKGAAGGIDLVKSSVSFALGTYVENLTLTGTADIAGTGSKFANMLIGNSGANRLDGGAGVDSLYGGLGNDTLKGGSGQDGFFFDKALSATLNVDSILDFSVTDDTIHLDRAVFSKIKVDGTLGTDAFFAGAAAHDGSDRIVYDAATGQIFYDADGTGATAAILFATVAPGVALTNLDFSAYAI